MSEQIVINFRSYKTMSQ